MNSQKLLHSKEVCLTRFLKFSRHFYEQMCRNSVVHSKWDTEKFMKRRDFYLRRLKILDSELMEMDQSSLKPLILSILETDLQIVKKLRSELSDLKQDLVTTEKAAGALRKFKSQWTSNQGSCLDERI